MGAPARRSSTDERVKRFRDHSASRAELALDHLVAGALCKFRRYEPLSCSAQHPAMPRPMCHGRNDSRFVVLRLSGAGLRPMESTHQTPVLSTSAMESITSRNIPDRYNIRNG